jgi:hypothetical protein
MTDNQAPVKSTTGRILLLLSAFTLVFAGISSSFDVYKYPFTGAVYEMLWLPFLLTLPLVIILASIKMFREKFSLQSNAFLALLIVCISILIMVLSNRK